MDFLFSGAAASISGAISNAMIMPPMGNVNMVPMGQVTMPTMGQITMPQGVAGVNPPPGFGGSVGTIVGGSTGTVNMGNDMFFGIPSPYPSSYTFPGYGNPNPFPGYGSNPFSGFGGGGGSCNPFFSAFFCGCSNNFYQGMFMGFGGFRC